jgi:hypothetical protein
MGAYDTSFNGGGDVFVAKLDPTGVDLLFATFAGGVGAEFGNGIDVDAGGSPYVTGYTDSPDWPTTPGAPQGILGGFFDVLVMKLNATGTDLVYSTYLGEIPDPAATWWYPDYGQSIAVDSSGNAYVTGFAGAPTFPTTGGAFQTTHNSIGWPDAFVTKLDPTGTILVYSTYLGGSQGETSWDIAVDAHGNAVVTGATNSADFPVTLGSFDPSHNGDYDAFVTKLDSAGASLVDSTYLGGSDLDGATGLALGGTASVYVVGSTESLDFPATGGAHDVGQNGLWDGFVVGIDLALGPGGGTCPHSQGYWKNHPQNWPVLTLYLGSETYDQAELISLLETPTRGDASLILAKQLIAAKLNVENESDPAPVSAEIAEAGALLATFTGKLPYEVHPSTATGQSMVALGAVLDEYNNKILTPGCTP